jgi:hypothetical protein
MATLRFSVIALALALGAPLAAQEANFGLGLSLSFPTGAFHSTNYAPSGGVTVPSNESYDTTVGGEFTVSFPVQPNFAWRLDIYAQGTSGEDTAPGYASYDLRHTLFSLGGEAQWFLADGDAYRHRGTFLLAGASMDLERFTLDYDYPYWTSYSVNKTRAGGLLGWGYAFRPYRGWHSDVEVAYHKTLDPGSTAYNFPTPPTPAADFLRLTYAIIF